MTAQSLNVRIALLLALPPLLWASNAVAGRMLVGAVPPVLINALRWVLALGVLLPLGWRAIGTPEARRQVLQRWKPLALLGLTGVGAYNALQYLALTTSTPLNATLITASSPVCMMLVGALFYGQRPTRRGLLGAALSLVGVAVVLARGELAALARISFVPGDLLMLLAMLSWSFYSWMLAKPAPSMAGEQRPAWDWWGFMLIQTLFGLAWAGSAAVLEAAKTELAALPEWKPEPIHGMVERVAAALELGMGKVAAPLRVAMTGTQVSPSIDYTIYLAGREGAIARIDDALARARTTAG